MSEVADVFSGTIFLIMFIIGINHPEWFVNIDKTALLTIFVISFYAAVWGFCQIIVFGCEILIKILILFINTKIGKNIIIKIKSIANIT
jgi:hypothetical protein